MGNVVVYPVGDILEQGLATKLGEGIVDDPDCSLVQEGPRLWVKDNRTKKIFRVEIERVLDSGRIPSDVLRMLEEG